MKKFWLESPDETRYGDFPFYNGKPFSLSWGKWITWFVITIFTFLLYTGDLFLMLGIKLKSKSVGSPLKLEMVEIGLLIALLVLLFAAFLWVSKGKWQTLFRKIHKNEVWFAVIGGPVALAIIGVYTKVVLEGMLGLNLVTDAALKMNSGDSIVSTISIVFQLMGEELGAIVPFLFIFAISQKVFRWNRSSSIWVAWIVSSIIFGIYHLSAYNDSWIQAILAIGVSRMLLTIPYIRYKNIWASYFFHLAYDFLPILIALVRAFTTKA